ncbi:hypothetical protein DITRI_Ditri03aG0093600 [Diplodiscus trichospermus]
MMMLKSELLRQLWSHLNGGTTYSPFVLSILLLFFLHLFFKLRRGSNLNFPPSPPKLPIIGNLHQLAGNLPHRSFQAMSEKYGPLMLLHLGQAPTLVVSSAEIVEELVKKHDIVFSNRPSLTAAKILFYGCSDFGFEPYGEYWRMARKICVFELLTTKRVQSFQFAREEVALLINKIRHASSNGGAVNLSEMGLATSYNIVSRCIIGQKAKEENGIFGELSKRYDMYVAGVETTATTIEWAMAELLKNPGIMKKAQEEVRRVVGRKGKIHEDDIDQMVYLKCIVKETLRLHRPGPLMTPREISAKIKLRGYYILPKTRVLVNVWAIQRDPKSWDRPQVFLLERFENNPIDFRGQNFEFIPFGVGRRGCPGISFGVAVLEFLIANLLCWFDWKLLDDNNCRSLDMTEAFGIAAYKKFPLHLVPVVYCS